eukprot:CAMPEP_0201739700 /NCGR_PEP_ID=MMETSP0593-20130828/45923_1 /ASSEMBLY_ACC=CAM_ASM_000672 /TAXON_ID=267983 /ORGANISM="Skeletonema japonicum, Strain CCMP2506" /LENGTH=137 /DNA_ID=CAMNT_0048233991 /DNA_START=79 /DNA_END=492 /DNA_ORIENTATION=-
MTVDGRPRSRSFSSTPTFSSDLAKLKSSLPQSTSSSSTVRSYKEAIAIASTFDVLGNNSALTPKLTLVSEDDWIQFFQKSGAVDTTTDTEEVVLVHMERFLRYCFDIAYKMPPSPNNRILREKCVKEASKVVPSLSI